MKFARFLRKKERKQTEVESWGLVTEDTIEVISGPPFGRWSLTGEKLKVYQVRYMAPCLPSKIICGGLNYKDHSEELGMQAPDEPIIFLKPSSSLQNPEGSIVKPPECNRLDFEAELAAVIKKKAKNISTEDAGEYILGYTCFNDVTARDIQRQDGQWTRAKSYDTFAPLGPVIVAGIDPNRLNIELFLNEKKMQSSNTSGMIVRVEKLVSIISGYMTLYPGDVISTGTPAGVGAMVPGDVVEVVIEKIGTLRNYVTEQ